jgi:hypothetical protein
MVGPIQKNKVVEQQVQFIILARNKSPGIEQAR